MPSGRATTRSQSYHGGAKGKLTGNTVQPAPAWRTRNIPAGSSDPGSRILLSNLPLDVSEVEIVDLMKKTIGPVNVRESFMIYTVKGYPRGMAIIAFTHGVDASRARGRYNGKVIDGKRAIKLEIILDRDADQSRPLLSTPDGAKAVQQKPKSLFDRLGPPSPNANQRTQLVKVAAKRPANPTGTKRQATLAERTSISAPVTPAPARKRQKKGPKRVKKTLADLDREMEEYTATRIDGGDSLMQTV